MRDQRFGIGPFVAQMLCATIPTNDDNDIYECRHEFMKSLIISLRVQRWKIMVQGFKRWSEFPKPVFLAQCYPGFDCFCLFLFKCTKMTKLDQNGECLIKMILTSMVLRLCNDPYKVNGICINNY